MQTPEEYEVTKRVIELLKLHKKRHGITKRKFSEKLGIGLTTLDDYLNGTSSFRLGTLMKLSWICKVKLSDLLEGTEAFCQLVNEDTKNEKKEENIENNVD
ncbi:helix-turn-helix domain-containing protein [Pseudoalteromonas fenneropenaei]|uniref:Helix-turn-helix domain-containing protein n=1 Tax=Pseudoalteromonas fenneropenaei TaxID=1737459 RepID=A0ABV7CJB1_9GAMM